MIEGYIYAADVHCTACIVPAVAASPQFDGLAVGIDMSTEQNLNEIAQAFGFERGNEWSFDSSDFPKRVTRQMLDYDHGWGPAGGTRCGSCHAPVGWVED